MKEVLKFFSIALFSFFISFAVFNSHIFTFAYSIPSNFRFNQNLKYKDSVYPDVNYLQTFLNMDRRTVVANTGMGSYNQPTSYFGTKTLDALKRFQQIYSKDILEPVGLYSPTGYFGAYTRAKVNSLLGSASYMNNTSYYSTQNTFTTTNNNSYTNTTQNQTNSPGVQSQNSSQNNPATNTSGNTYTNPYTGYTASTNVSSNQNTQSGNGSGSSGSSGGGNSTTNGIIGGVSGVAASTLLNYGSSALGGGSKASSGAGTSGALPFGGMVSRVTMCTCTGASMLDINDSQKGYLQLIYQPGASQLYANFDVYSSGHYVLGTYMAGGGQCEVYDGESCDSQGSPQGTIQMIGTGQ